jgi:hypothetical protein
MKIALSVIGVVMVLSLFGVMMMGVRDAQTNEREDSFAAVTTGVGENTADVILVTDIYNDDLLSVISIESDNGSDAPLPDAFVPSTNTLTVRGLNASDTRTLTVTYEYAALTGPSESAGSFLDYVPLFVAIAAILIVVGGIIAVFVTRRGG